MKYIRPVRIPAAYRYIFNTIHSIISSSLIKTGQQQPNQQSPQQPNAISTIDSVLSSIVRVLQKLDQLEAQGRGGIDRDFMENRYSALYNILTGYKYLLLGDKEKANIAFGKAKDYESHAQYLYSLRKRSGPDWAEAGRHAHYNLLHPDERKGLEAAEDLVYSQLKQLFGDNYDLMRSFAYNMEVLHHNLSDSYAGYTPFHIPGHSLIVPELPQRVVKSMNQVEYNQYLQATRPQDLTRSKTPPPYSSGAPVPYYGYGHDTSAQSTSSANTQASAKENWKTENQLGPFASPQISTTAVQAATGVKGQQGYSQAPVINFPTTSTPGTNLAANTGSLNLNQTGQIAQQPQNVNQQQASATANISTGASKQKCNAYTT